ncbi:MAG TPA: M20/M25/M40 family metallo-hydrolase [bacterium]|nr:M20/M25/M40 family metallo-hydrolase [bacterium]
MAQRLQMAPVFDHIDRHQPQHLDRLLELIRVPSISAENRGMTECAELLASYYRGLGCQRVEIVPTKGQPVVYAEYRAGKPVTLLVYFMYDVKQITGEEWTLVRDPFDPQVVERSPFRRCLVGRGAVNQKGPLGAFLNAVESIRATGQELPVNLKFISDGEEEIGSPRLVDFATAYVDRLRDAQAAIFPTASQNLKGVPMVALGCKGSAPFELECSGALWGRGPRRFDIHSSNAAMVDHPAWRLIQALATMTDPAHPDRITIDDFYDDVLPPAADDVALVDRMAPNYDEESAKQVLAVDRFIDDVHGRDALMKLFFAPTLNIQGIVGGYIGPDFKTSMPHRVRAKFECRLVPNQTYRGVLDKVRRHLDRRGYPDIQIVAVRGGRSVEDARSHEWARTSPTSPFVEALVRSCRQRGAEPLIAPTNAGSAPWHVFTKRPLQIPLLPVGLNHGGRAHSPDEYLVIEGNDQVKGLAEFEKSFVAALDEMAAVG